MIMQRSAEDIVDSDKKHLHFEGNAMEEIELSQENLDFIRQFDIVYCERWAKIGRYIRQVKRSEQIWVYDFSKRLEQPGNDELIPYLDYVFFSYDRDDEYIREFLRKTWQKGVRYAIAMLGERGSLAYDGTAFYKQKDLDAELQRQKEARERDHRVIGNELDLFFVDPKVGAGLPYWMPNGATIRRVIERYIIDKEVAWGFQHVYTPVLANLNLYKQSGHWDHYREDMFPPMDMGDGEMLELRPMNCPSHIQVYNHHKRSYRELPLRIAELGMMHRYEKSGALTGLSRVREMTLNDGHDFIEPDHIEDEIKTLIKLMTEVYNDFDITDYRFRLSYRDPKNTEKYFDDDEMWEKSQSKLKAAMDDMGLEYFEAEGEAAFYGPKIDVQTKTALGGEETLSTIQLDFLLPERFDLKYIGADGEEHRPVMVHRGIVSTMERFTAYLTEMYKGAFPTWLAPHQVDIIPVKNDLHMDYVNDLSSTLRAHGIRVTVDDRNEKMGYKIRQAQVNKIPYTLVIGDEEVSNGTVTVRKYGEEKTNTMTKDEFKNLLFEDIENYSREK